MLMVLDKQTPLPLSMWGYDATLQKRELFICEEYCTTYLGVRFVPTCSLKLCSVCCAAVTFRMTSDHMSFVHVNTKHPSYLVIVSSVSSVTIWGHMMPSRVFSISWMISGLILVMMTLKIRMQFLGTQRNAACCPSFAWARVTWQISCLWCCLPLSIVHVVQPREMIPKLNLEHQDIQSFWLTTSSVLMTPMNVTIKECTDRRVIRLHCFAAQSRCSGILPRVGGEHWQPGTEHWRVWRTCYLMSFGPGQLDSTLFYIIHIHIPYSRLNHKSYESNEKIDRLTGTNIIQYC